jgi:hypothetical protein
LPENRAATSWWSRLRAWWKLEYWGFLIIVLVLGIVIVYNRVTQPDGAQVVLQFERNGPGVNDDLSLVAAMSGDVTVDESLAQWAYCVNGWYWYTDVTLDTLVLVSTNERLVRAAELAAGSRFDAGLVEAVERAVFDDPDRGDVTVDELPTSLRDRYATAELERYLDALSEPPSDRARERFVVYAVSETIWDQFIMFIDLDNVDRAAINRFDALFGIGEDEILVAGQPAFGPVSNTDCAELLD